MRQLRLKDDKYTYYFQHIKHLEESLRRCREYDRKQDFIQMAYLVILNETGEVIKNRHTGVCGIIDYSGCIPELDIKEYS